MSKATGRTITAVAALVWLCSWVIMFSIGCGGDGGDIPVETALPALPTGASIQCAHDGDVYICNDQECFPDSEYEVVGVAEEEEEEEPTEEGDQFLVRSKLEISGPVTIINECGSNVVFNLQEDNSTVDLDGAITTP